MGTDIHMFIEVKRDGRWQILQPPEPITEEEKKDWNHLGHDYAYYGAAITEEEWRENYSEAPLAAKIAVPWQLNRNYDLFAILADVRNGRGFAGCVTGAGFNYISRPRGLPKDLSPEVQAHMDVFLEHTPTWLTLKEVLDFNWNQGTEHYGWVDTSEFKTFKEKGAPDCWSGGVEGSSVQKVTPGEMTALLEKGQATHNHFTQVTWKEGYKAAAGALWTDLIPELQKLPDVPTDIRLVFYFDS